MANKDAPIVSPTVETLSRPPKPLLHPSEERFREPEPATKWRTEVDRNGFKIETAVG